RGQVLLGHRLPPPGSPGQLPRRTARDGGADDGLGPPPHSGRERGRGLCLVNSLRAGSSRRSTVSTLNLCRLTKGATGGLSASARRWARAGQLPVAPQTEGNA